MPRLPPTKKIAGLAAAWVASNLAWTLFSGFVGAFVGAILKDKGVFENTYGLVATGFLVAAAVVSAPAFTRWVRHRHHEAYPDDEGMQRAGGIRAGHGIRAGGNIEAADIKAGRDIDAGGNIQATALTRRTEIDSHARLPLPALADELSRYRERGVVIRREIDPPMGYAASSISLLNQTIPALGEQRVRSWSIGVRAHLEKHAPRFLVVFDEGPDLPQPHLLAALLATTNRSELLTFLDHKLAALERIIRAIIGGSDA